MIQDGHIELERYKINAIELQVEDRGWRYKDGGGRSIDDRTAVTYNYLLVCKYEYIPLVYLFLMSFIVPLISDHCAVD